MAKVTVGQLTNRVRCWRCGQVGHMARNCQALGGGGTGGSWTAQGASASAGGSSTAPQSQHGGSSRGSSKGYFVGFTWTPKGQEQNYLTWKTKADHAGCHVIDRSGCHVADRAGCLCSTDHAGCHVIDRSGCHVTDRAGCLCSTDRAGCLVNDRAGCLCSTDHAICHVIDHADHECCLDDKEKANSSSPGIPSTYMEGQCSYFVTSPHLAVMDTGAVNGVIGTTQFLILCQMLQRHGLHAYIDRECTGTPSSIGGIVGGAEVVCTAQTPTAVAGIPGIISFIVITGEVPALFPLPLMRTLGGVLHFPRQCVIWTQHADCESPLIDLPSGHVGCSILDGVEKFATEHPSAEHFSQTHSAMDDLRWVREQTFALTKKKNEKRAVHFELEGDHELVPRSCLSSSHQQQQHEPSTSSSVAGVVTTEGTSDASTVCDHSRQKRSQFMGSSHTSRTIGLAGGCLTTSCDLRTQSISSNGCQPICNEIISIFEHTLAAHDHDGAGNSCTHLLLQPTQAVQGVEGDVSWGGQQGLHTSAATSKGERSREVVQLHSMSDALVERGWGVLADRDV
eukprot:6041282-Amphidinium_carterae.1